jgi:hypothetical protein
MLALDAVFLKALQQITSKHIAALSQMLLDYHVFVSEMREALYVVDITVLDPFDGRPPFD